MGPFNLQGSTRSGVLTKPVTWSLMGSEHLFSELLVSTVLDSVHFKSVGVTVDIMILCEHVRNWVHGGHDAHGHVDDYSGVWNLVTGDERQILRDIMGHLRSRGWSSIFVLDHTIMQLRRHCNNHVIEVGVEMSTLWDIKTKWWVVMISSQKVVRVVDQTWGMRQNLGKIGRPDTHVGLFGLMHGEVRSPHSIMDNSLSEVPLVEVVALVLLMTWMDFREEDHLIHEFSLFETLIHKQIVLLVHSSMATLAGSLEDLETSSESLRVVGVEAVFRRPVVVTVMHTN